MKRQEITVKAKQGIHATPAVVLVNQARSYKSDIKLYEECFACTWASSTM